jgi:CHAD domain-containing protein
MPSPATWLTSPSAQPAAKVANAKAINAKAINAKAIKKIGLAFWMQSVLEQCDRASVDFSPDPVHDLRVALRRCRSMADGIMAIDPDPAWKEMKKSGKPLFSRLGDLRDTQVMEEWVHRLDSPGDPVTTKLLQFLAAREAEFKQESAKALEEFDRKQWRRWIKTLPRRAARLRSGSDIFKHLALERWIEAYELHRRALRNRSQVAFHSLRIGIKRFRYIVENFLPQQHAAWSDDLKDLQDLLGEVHDLDVVWSTALQVDVFPDAASRSRWHARIIEERTARIGKYRAKMMGKNSLWQVWRAELPQGEQIEAAALHRLQFWASVLDPDFKHSDHVTGLALQLYDGLPSKQHTSAGNHRNSNHAANHRNLNRHDSSHSDQRAILQVAALLHDVGRSKREKKSHKATYKLINRLKPPAGWSAESLHLAAAISRYHQGALPHAGQASLRGLTPEQRRTVLRLAGILRLADALDSNRDGRIQRLHVAENNGFLVVAAQGYSPRDRLAENIAAARHLLEVVYRRPVMVKPLLAKR